MGIALLYPMLFRLCLLLLSPFAWGMELYTWTPHVGRTPIVIGVRDGETPRQAAEAFVRGLTNGPRYKNLTELFGRSETSVIPVLRFENFRRLSDHDFKRRVLLVANRPEDLRRNDWRVPTFSEPFAQLEMPPYLVPFAADAAMNDADKAKFISLLNEKFPRFVGMGGDDVAGENFGDSDHGSVDFNADRDAFEIDLFSKKIQTIRGANPGDHRIWGTCRALQLIARIIGQKIYPHIDGHGGTGEGALQYRATNVEPTHAVRIFKTAWSILLGIVGSNEAVVNSYHHKFSVEVENGYLQKSAESPDKIPEAYESVDGRIFLLQFHAELMRVRSEGKIRELGEKIFKGAAEFLLNGPGCEQKLLKTG